MDNTESEYTILPLDHLLQNPSTSVEGASFFEKQDRYDEVPELKTYNVLKEEDVHGLEIISDEEFSDIVDSIILNDYKNIPNSIRLPNLNDQLAEKLGLSKDTAFILKKNATHIRPDRKGGYGQAFDTEEYRLIPEIVRTATFAVIDKAFKNFQIVFDDINDETKINKLVFNKDKLGNYLVTLGKVDRENTFSLERNSVVAVGVAPTIQTLKTRASSTALRASTTTVTENINHNTTSVNTSLEQGATNNTHQTGKGVYMSKILQFVRENGGDGFIEFTNDNIEIFIEHWNVFKPKKFNHPMTNGMAQIILNKIGMQYTVGLITQGNNTVLTPDEVTVYDNNNNKVIGNISLEDFFEKVRALKASNSNDGYLLNNILDIFNDSTTYDEYQRRIYNEFVNNHDETQNLEDFKYILTEEWMDRQHPEISVDKEISSLNEELSVVPAKSERLKGWTWHQYDDGSGSLRTPEGNPILQYDVGPREVYYEKNTIWSMADGFDYSYGDLLWYDFGRFKSVMEKKVQREVYNEPYIDNNIISQVAQKDGISLTERESESIRSLMGMSPVAIYPSTLTTSVGSFSKLVNELHQDYQENYSKYSDTIFFEATPYSISVLESLHKKIVENTMFNNHAHQAGKGVYMSNEFAELEDQYLERMANGGASDRALEEDYLEQETNNQDQESQKENGNLYSHGQDAGEGRRKPYYQQQAESLLEAVKGGRVPFLPQEPVLGEDGRMVSSGNYSQDGDKLVITPRPAVRMLSGNILTGVNQLTAQIELDRMGRKSQTVLTWEQAKAEGCFIKKGAQSFVLTGYDKDAGEGQSKSKVYHVFAAGDVSNGKIIQGALNKNANANAPKPWTKEVLGCHDGTPAKFLGTYMAASATGAKFETDRATVQQFQQQFTQMMEKSIEEKQHTAIFEVGRNAQKYASAIRDNGYKQWEKAQDREKEANTRNLQQRARGMEMGL